MNICSGFGHILVQCTSFFVRITIQATLVEVGQKYFHCSRSKKVKIVKILSRHYFTMEEIKVSLKESLNRGIDIGEFITRSSEGYLLKDTYKDKEH